MIARTIEVTAEISKNIITATAELTERTIEATAEMTTSVTHYHSEYPTYGGEVVVTPSEEAQTLPTARTVLLEDITINPIPSNYGLITWNGSTLTVS